MATHLNRGGSSIPLQIRITQKYDEVERNQLTWIKRKRPVNTSDYINIFPSTIRAYSRDWVKKASYFLVLAIL
jgi:hypothetical protein